MDDQESMMETSRGPTPRSDKVIRHLSRIEAMAGMGMLGCTISGAFGHDLDNIQRAATLEASWFGGLLCD